MVYSKKKNNVNYLEFDRGYSLIGRDALLGVIQAYRSGEFRKNELRVFAALFERSALHKQSKVDIYRIVNQDSLRRGVKRLSESQIDAALEKVSQLIGNHSTGESKPVSRKYLRHIAKGAASCSEALTLFYYCHHRVRQPKRYQRLVENERYARFTYGELSKLSGLRKATLSEAVGRLAQKGYLNTTDVAKQNENVYGQLYIDGPLVSLTRRKIENKAYQRNRRRNKTVTPGNKKRNAPGMKTVTLKNNNPKIENPKTEKSFRKERTRNETIASMKRCLQSKFPEIREAAQTALQEYESSMSQAA